MDRYLEFRLLDVEPTLGAELQERFNKTLLSFSPEDKKLNGVCKDTCKGVSGLGALTITNLDVWRKINAMIDFLNSTSTEDDVKRIRNIEPIPVEIEKLSQAWKIISCVEQVIFDFYKIDSAHLNKCFVHQFYWQIAWQSFIVSLFGFDYGFLYNSFIGSLEEAITNSFNICSPPISLN